MSLPVRLLELYTPRWAQNRALSQLLTFTAAAFECPPPATAGLNVEQRLRQYALFTRDHVAWALRDGAGLPALQERLYRNAHELGRMYGWMVPGHGMGDVMALGRVLYRILRIDFRGDAQGDVAISRCYFSDYYSGAVCRVMSAMDSGLLAGLAGGGRLAFSARITEGQACCRAHFSM